MAIDQSWLDGLLSGYNQILINGTPLPQRPILNLIGPTGVDNPSNGQTNVTVSGGGGSTFGQHNITLVNGLNSNVATAGQQTLRIGGPSAPYWIGGLTPPTSGALATLVVIDTTGQLFGIMNADPNSTASWQINVDGFSSSQIAYALRRPGAKLVLQYDFTLSGWQLVHLGYSTAHQNEISVADYGAGTTVNGYTDATAFQAAIWEAESIPSLISQPGQGKIVVPTNKTYYFENPVFITGSNVILEGEVTSTYSGAPCPTIEVNGQFMSDAIVIGPTTQVAPTITAVSAGTGNISIVHLASMIAGTNPQLFFTETACGNINGFAGLCVSFFYQFSAYPSDQCWMIGSGGFDGFVTSSYGMTVYWNAANGLTFQLVTTTGSHTLVYNDPWNVGFPSMYHIEMDYDGAHLYAFVNGVLLGSTAVTGTIVQEPWEDLTIGSGFANASGPLYGQYPFGTPSVATCATAVGIGNIIIDASARHTSAFSPPTANVAPNAASNGTTLCCNFDAFTFPDPHYQAAGFTGVINSISGHTIPAQVVAKSFANPLTPSTLINGSTIGYASWLNWMNTTVAAGYASGVQIRNLNFYVSNGVGGGAIRACLAVGLRLEDIYLLVTGRGITLVNNCYVSFCRRVNGVITAVGSANSWTLAAAAGGQNQLTWDDCSAIGGSYGFVFCGASLNARGLYAECATGGGSTAGILLQCQNGTIQLQGCTVGDDNAGGYYGHGYTDAGIIFNGGSPLGFQATTLEISGSHVLCESGPAPCLAVNQANALAPITITGSTFAQLSGGVDFNFAAAPTYPAPLIIDYNSYNQAITFGGSYVPPTQVIGYDVMPVTLAFASNAALTLTQDNWLHSQVWIIDPHPYLTGTQTVNLPFLFSGKTAYLHNSTAQTLTFKWVGGTGATGLNLAAGYGMNVRSDGTNLFQTTAAISPG